MSLDQQQMRTKQQGGVFLLISLLLIGSNLRAPLTSVGSLVPSIREQLELSHTTVGLITTVPLVAFALVSPFAPKLANRFGMERMIFISMVILVVGIGLRSVAGVSMLFIGTALIGVAISFGNVLIPGFVKMSFPFRIGLTTGLYAVCMNIFGSLASGVSVPLSNIGSFGWRGALGAWIGLAIIALIAWYPHVKSPTPRLAIPIESTKKKTNMWTSITAWQVTIFMGLQSLIFYTTLAWLPEILQLIGYSSNEAGWMLSLMQFSLIPFTFIIPIIAGKMDNQKRLSALTGIVLMLGTAGLLSGISSLVVASVVLLGIGCGSAFSLSMMFFTLRTTDGYAASELSGMAQSFGYLLAACGPVLFGFLHDLTGSWTTPLVLLCLIAVIIFISGLLAGRRVVIDG